MAKKAKAEAPVEVEGDPCPVEGCGLPRRGNRFFCRQCISSLAGAPRSLIERGWWADAVEMERVAADMKQWIEESGG